MIKINGDHLLRLLGQPEWDNEVIEVTKTLGLGRVKVPDSRFSEDFRIDKFNICLLYTSPSPRDRG